MLSAGRKRKLHIAALTCAVCLALCGCAPRVDFEDKDVSVEKTEVSLVLQPGETAKLDELPALERADLSGSECYDEIIAWQAAHPDVEVIYTVTFPDGTTADNSAQSLTLGAISPDDVQLTARLAGYLPALKELDLSGAGLSPEGAAAIAEALPDVHIIYACELLGQTVGLETESLDLRGASAAQLVAAADVMKHLPGLKTVQLGSELENPLDWETLAALVQGCPQVDFEYGFTLYGKAFTLLDSELDLNHITVEDGGALAYAAAGCMKNLKVLDMDFCGVSNEEMAVIRDAYPDVNVVWRIWFGDSYSVRTDVEKILASKPSAGGLVRDRDAEALKYCTKVKYLDVGHNEILTDISFVSYMPELEVAVLAMNNIADLSPLASCKKLEYLEIQTNARITDLSPLASCTELEHLNIANCRNFSDITPLFGLNKLKRLWLGCSAPVPQEQIEEFAALHPDCELNTTVWSDPTSEGWRVDHVDPYTNQVYYDERYEKLIEQFGYLKGDYSLASKDPKYKAG